MLFVITWLPTGLFFAPVGLEVDDSVLCILSAQLQGLCLGTGISGGGKSELLCLRGLHLGDFAGISEHDSVSDSVCRLFLELKSPSFKICQSKPDYDNQFNAMINTILTYELINFIQQRVSFKLNQMPKRCNEISIIESKWPVYMEGEGDPGTRVTLQAGLPLRGRANFSYISLQSTLKCLHD